MPFVIHAGARIHWRSDGDPALPALGRWEEFRLHASAGLQRELSRTDLKELLHQVAVYAGVPAANTGFRHADELLRELRAAHGA